MACWARGVGLATGLVVALFPFAAIGGGLVAATTGGGAILGAVAGHAAAGMSRHDLKELGEQLDAGQAGLVVVGVSDMGAKIEAAMKKASKVEAKSMKADTAALEADVGTALSESPEKRQPEAPDRLRNFGVVATGIDGGLRSGLWLEPQPPNGNCGQVGPYSARSPMFVAHSSSVRLRPARRQAASTQWSGSRSQIW